MNQAYGNTGLHHIPQRLSHSARDDVELNGFADYQWLLMAVGNLAPRAAMGRLLPLVNGGNRPFRSLSVAKRVLLGNIFCRFFNVWEYRALIDAGLGTDLPL